MLLRTMFYSSMLLISSMSYAASNYAPLTDAQKEAQRKVIEAMQRQNEEADRKAAEIHQNQDPAAAAADRQPWAKKSPAARAQWLLKHEVVKK